MPYTVVEGLVAAPLFWNSGYVKDKPDFVVDCIVNSLHTVGVVP